MNNKIFITPDSEHDYNKQYKQFSIVTHTIDNIVKTYIAKVDVPQFVSILNTSYWKEITSDTSEQGTVDYDNLENKPTINGVELDGNKTSQELGVYSKPSTGIPQSDLSSDVQSQLNKHFKGWFNTLTELKAAYTATDGDSAYVKDASPATTWSIYVYDSTASSDNYWADSGTDADTSNVQTFASSQEVNEVHIVNDLTTGGVNDVLSAEMGKSLDNNFYTEIDLSDYTPNTGTIMYSNWVSHSGTSIVVPVTPNAIYKIIASQNGNSDYAFLTQTIWGPTGTSAQFATGYTDRVTLSMANTAIVIAPANAKTLYIRMLSGSNIDISPKVYRNIGFKEYLPIIPTALSETQQQQTRENISVPSNNEVLNRDLTNSLVVERATLVRSSGVYAGTLTETYGAIQAFIPVKPGQKFLTNAFGKNYDAGICYYSAANEGSFVSAIDGCVNASTPEVFTVPSDAYYLRICCMYYSTYGLKLVVYGTSVDDFPKEDNYNLVTSNGVFNLYKQHFGIEAGRKIVCLGDSITQGDNIGNNLGKSYPQRMMEITKADVYNAGLGGATYTTATTYGFTAMVDAIVSGDWTTIDSVVDNRAQQSAYSYLRDRFDGIEALDFSKVDIITIAFGTNDFAQNQVLDNQNNPTDKTTILGALRYGLDALLTAYPQLRIYVFTPSFRFNLGGSESNNTDNTTNSNGLYTIDICDAIEEVCESFHVPCKNMYKDSCFNKYTWPILTPTVSGGGKDGTHPNDLGAYRLALLFSKFISTE